MTLRAIVVGTGWAGEGHTLALQAAGVEVAAICGRTLERTQALAHKLRVEAARLDVHAALDEFEPDIVSVATPGGAHHSTAVAAAQARCHVVCEKPLAVTVTHAREMVEAVEAAGVKHAYAATGPFNAAFYYARGLLADGVIGTVRMVQHQSQGFSIPPTLSYSWHHRFDEGGGVLNNIFTHHLQIVVFTTRAAVTAAIGTAYRSLQQTPVGKASHDARQLSDTVLDRADADAAEWRPVDADQGYTALLKLAMPEGHTATALITMPEATHEPYPNFLAFHGSNGSLYLSAASDGYIQDDRIRRYDVDRGDWVDMEVPQDVGPAWPQSGWNRIFGQFVDDVRGESDGGDPTFHDGLMAVKVIEIVRSGRGWQPI
ncbi:MAG: Gfo/Idh/MocA family oxidoreductase [Chloroflexi bacterium]|nr:Gfo/Idh/MocA family oxidoreductase [Chloroflexota bacterium]